MIQPPGPYLKVLNLQEDAFSKKLQAAQLHGPEQGQIRTI